jgi:chaperonin GroEL
LQGGIAPGGGVAYLACIPSLRNLELREDEAAGAAILASALTAPLRAILENSGVEASHIMAQLTQSANGSNGCGYDVMGNTMTDMWAANIVDPLKVLQVALESGVSGALMALTTDVLVHKPRHNRSKEVDLRP